jgi:glutathione S-transferase
MTYQLYYWPGLQGRGEFVRLALEDAGAPYEDVVRQGDMSEMTRLLAGSSAPQAFAPPVLRDGDLFLSQTANILMYLGRKHGLAPAEPMAYAANALQLTLADFVGEVHDTHHPFASGLTYEDQREAAKVRARHFLTDRVAKYLGYFEHVLAREGAEFLVGEAHSYVDLSMFQVIEGLTYAFPRATNGFGQVYPCLDRLRARVAARPKLTEYLGSDRRIPFNETGIFRRYPELDQDPV